MALSFPYKTNYNDHFETPLIAYQDVAPLLDIIGGGEEKRKNHVLYDPYYCNGRTSKILGSISFTSVHHEKRDFYLDVEQKKTPSDYRTMITNPPYSDDHKEKCLRFALDQLRNHGKSFLLLLPNYIATKDYYRNIISMKDGSEPNDIMYIIPSSPYEYDHPEGTGKEVCPFASIWYCGVCLKHIKSAKKIYNQISDCGNNLKNNDKERPILATSYHELKLLNVIPTLKRGNPRQRRKMKQKNLMLNYQQCLNESVGDVKEEMKLTSITSNGKSLKEIAPFTRKEPKKDERKRISSDGKPNKHVDMSQPITMEDSKKLNKLKKKNTHRDANGFRKRRRF